jgi:hypothetical protein
LQTAYGATGFSGAFEDSDGVCVPLKKLIISVFFLTYTLYFLSGEESVAPEGEGTQTMIEAPKQGKVDKIPAVTP